VLVRRLRSTAEVEDLSQEVFLRAIDRIAELNAGVALGSWFSSFAVNVARETLRARARRRWLLFVAPENVPDPSDGIDAGDTKVDAGLDARRALRATYEVLGRMHVGLRMAFVLRRLEGMDLLEVSRACGVSLATAKRRIDAAEATFCVRASRHPVLHAWIAESNRSLSQRRRTRFSLARSSGPNSPSTTRRPR
jgi:RNA polymerase sigma-70 factor (ECF subfamily)